jgi:hypothetical protein
MSIEFFKTLGKTFANPLLNGFESDLSPTDRKIVTIAHFCPFNKWGIENPFGVEDFTTGDAYNPDGQVRMKCMALMLGTLTLQPIALFLNVINRTIKVVTFAQLWHSTSEQVTFKARVKEWAMDVLRIVTTPLVLIGLFFSALYGATISPNNGRKLYASFERFAYSGGYMRFPPSNSRRPHNYFMAPCFQPLTIGYEFVHLFGGKAGDRNAW